MRSRHLSNLSTNDQLPLNFNVKLSLRQKLRQWVQKLPYEISLEILQKTSMAACLDIYTSTRHPAAKLALSERFIQYNMPNANANLEDSHGFHKIKDYLRQAIYSCGPKEQPKDISESLREVFCRGRMRDSWHTFKMVKGTEDTTGMTLLHAQEVDTPPDHKITVCIGYKNQKKMLIKGDPGQIMEAKFEAPKTMISKVLHLAVFKHIVYYDMEDLQRGFHIFSFNLLTGKSFKIFHIPSPDRWTYCRLCVSESFIYFFHGKVAYHTVSPDVWRYNTKTGERKGFRLNNVMNIRGNKVEVSDTHLFFSEPYGYLDIWIYSRKEARYISSFRSLLCVTEQLMPNVYIIAEEIGFYRLVNVVFAVEEGVKMVRVKRCVLCCQIIVHDCNVFTIKEPHFTSTYFFDHVTGTLLNLHHRQENSDFSVKRGLLSRNDTYLEARYTSNKTNRRRVRSI